MEKQDFTRIVLDNGVVLIVAPMDTKKTVIHVFVKNGAQFERKKESGISHYVEHYLFRGTKRLPDFRAIEELLHSINAEPHAHTDYEEVCYAIKTSIRHFEKALGVLTDVLIEPTFKADEIKTETNIILQEIGARSDKPSTYLQSVLWPQVCYGDQPAGRPVIGYEETVRSFTPKSLIRWYKKHYVGDAIKVVVAGSKDIEKFIPELKEVFGRIPPGQAQYVFIPRDNQKAPQCLTFSADTSLAHLYLGAKTPFRSTDNGGYAAMILASIVNRNIYYSMIGDRGLSYERSVEYLEDPTKSCLVAYAGITPSRLEETIKLILAEYRRSRDLGITQKELTTEIENRVEEIKENFEDEPMAVSSFYGRDELYRGVSHTLKEEIQKIEAITRNDIQEAARQIFLPQNLNLAVLGPQNNIKEITKTLKSF